MDKQQLIDRLNHLYQNPAKRLHEKIKGSRPNIWKWLNEPSRRSEKIEQAAEELIEQAMISYEATSKVGEPIKL